MSDILLKVAALNDFYHSRENGFIINVIIAGDLPGVVAVHFNDLREIVIDGIEGQVLFFTPEDGLLQGFAGTAGP